MKSTAGGSSLVIWETLSKRKRVSEIRTIAKLTLARLAQATIDHALRGLVLPQPRLAFGNHTAEPDDDPILTLLDLHSPPGELPPTRQTALLVDRLERGHRVLFEGQWDSETGPR